MANDTELVASRLETDRNDLLDLTLRNPLLNYRPRSRGLEFVGESPVEVFRLLVRERRKMSFLHDPSAVDEPSAEPGAPAQTRPRPPLLETNTTDLKLQTMLSARQLEKRLLATYLSARTSVEEQGVNTLFLTLGMLFWEEADSGAKVLRAPLILIPVELERSSARERFSLRHDEGDLGFNLSLAEKLKADFGISLPELPEDDEADIAAYFDALTETVAGRQGWSVERNEIKLGFFSFGKFLMYVDLDNRGWPEDELPTARPILRALLQDGFHEPASEFGENEPVDPHVNPQDARQVVDADSSQILAILEVKGGRNLVIQGPPGTGKSQTITNLIAEAMGQGKTVLFVAEKMAALEVVKRRLDAAGLGDACLELHSQKTNKKAVLAELKRTLDLDRPRPAGSDDDIRRLVDVRDRLNAYCEALNAPVAPSGVTPQRAFGELLLLRTDSNAILPRPDVPAMPSWATYEFARRLEKVAQLQGRVETVGVPREHLFWGSRRKLFLPVDAEALRSRIAAVSAATTALSAAGKRLAGLLKLEKATSRERCEALLLASRRAAAAAQLLGADVRSAEWQTRRADLQELHSAGAGLAELHRRFDDTLTPDAWGQELSETRRDLNKLGRSWWRIFYSAYRQAMRRVASICRGKPPGGLEARLALVDAILDAQRHHETLQRHNALAARLFAAHWQGERSNWDALAKVDHWIEQLHAEVRDGRLPAGIVELLAALPVLDGLDALARDVRGALDVQCDTVKALLEFLEFDETLRFGSGGFAAQAFNDQESLLALWSERADDLVPLVALNRVADECRNAGLAGVVALVESRSDASSGLVGSFRRWWFEGIVERAFRERPALAGFDGLGQSQAVDAFRQLDKKALRYAQTRLAYEHWRSLPRHDGGGQLDVLRREFEKKARHRPVRKLMADAGNAVQAIKRVFMMSPLSVAAFLPPKCMRFDLVVFDEASQVRPVDAFGALLRGRQAVVVGDDKQLPPTGFFDRLTGGDDSEDDEGDQPSGVIPSILGLFLSRNARQRMLRWHYRSRHESLIAVSNHEFYDDRLIVFPSPDAARGKTGLIFHHLPNTAYDRGKTRTNPGEADEVVKAVGEFAREQLARPAAERQTLGVATFSTAQMEAINDRLEELRRDPSFEAFFADRAVEPFFVKNLENVQGDERDVIFISVGYGRTAEGDLAMNFGPLNNDGGERRLNVLITRARCRCEVFTNMTADAIDLNRTRARGVQALKTFLAYAQTGHLDMAIAAGGETESPFETSVLAAVTSAGYQVQQQVGSASSRIDLAVVDPAQSGRYMLAIESDGASYQSARSARDRDRLRQMVLEGLGWRFHRIWSTEWFRDPERELKRTVLAIEQATVASPAPAPPAETADRHEETPTDAKAGTELAGELSPSVTIPVYQVAALTLDLAGRDLHEVPTPELAACVFEVVRLEGPVLASEVTRRIADAAGVKRVGTRIQAALDLAVDQATRQGRVRRQDDFLWPADMSATVIRDRSALPAAMRKLDLVATEEIAAAVERVVVDSFGMEPSAIPAAAGRLLGFNRISDEMRRRVEGIVAAMLAEKRLLARGEHLVIPDLKVAG